MRRISKMSCKLKITEINVKITEIKIKFDKLNEMNKTN